MNQKDYYQILGVGESAGPEQIRQAYRKLAFQYHPDRNKGNPVVTDKMKEINEAYATLSDAQKRREYDALRERFGDLAYERFRQTHRPEDIFRGSDIDQIFEDFARTFGFRGSDDIFREFYGPGYRSFQFRRGGVFGRGFIFYHQPRPTSTGEKGEHPAQWPSIGPPLSGIFGKASKYLLRRTFGMQFPERGEDWREVISLSPKKAQGGGEIEYRYRKRGKSKNLMVKVPPGIRDGQRIRLRGMGAPGKGGEEPGHLYLKVRIKRSLLSRIKDVFTK